MKNLNFVLGFIVIFVAILLVTIFLKKTKPPLQTTKEPKTYKIKAGDYLWKIAETTYGSGFNAYDIAQANNITNPDLVFENVTLVLPEVPAKTPTMGETTSTKTGQVILKTSSYVVQEGDSLWSIAQEAYGDGNVWVRIAQANNLTNPDMIYAGLILKIGK